MKFSKKKRETYSEHIKSVNLNKLKQKDAGLRGLKNIGNTCFMNSSIQCVSNIPVVKNFFLSSDLKQSLRYDNTVFKSLWEVLVSIWSLHGSESMESIEPRSLKVQISENARRFEGFEQQDSHEFLTYLLDGLHEELKQDSGKDSTDFKEHIVEFSVLMESFNNIGNNLWKHYMMHNSSVISYLFHFMVCQSSLCLECGHTSLKYDSMSCVSLPIPYKNKASSHKRKHDEPLNINDCFEELTKITQTKIPEYFCDKCNKKTMTKDKLTFFNLPKVLIVQFNRFKYDRNGMRVKDSTNIKFSTKLNLSKFIGLETNDNFNGDYNLIAVSNHYGSISGGHYTTFAKNDVNGDWYEFNDSYVAKIDPSKICTPNAYYLIYTRTDIDPLEMGNFLDNNNETQKKSKGRVRNNIFLRCIFACVHYFHRVKFTKSKYKKKVSIPHLRASSIENYKKKMIQLTIQGFSGEKYVFDLGKETSVLNTMTVLKLKENLIKEKSLDQAPGSMRIIFGGKQLDDEKYLKDYKIQNRSLLFVVSRLDGGFY